MHAQLCFNSCWAKPLTNKWLKLGDWMFSHQGFASVSEVFFAELIVLLTCIFWVVWSYGWMQGFLSLRQSIAGHPFGTMKRQWGFNYILSKKGMASTSADVGFMFIAYNLRRLINILDIKILFNVQNIIVLHFFRFFRTIQAKLSQFLTVPPWIQLLKINKCLFFTFIFEDKLEFQRGLWDRLSLQAMLEIWIPAYYHKSFWW